MMYSVAFGEHSLTKEDRPVTHAKAVTAALLALACVALGLTVVATSASAGTGCGSGQVCFYRDVDYANDGTTRTIAWATPRDCTSWSRTNLRDIARAGGGTWNDQISSVVNNSDVDVSFFSDAGFGGDAFNVPAHSAVPNLTAYRDLPWRSNFNDWASSIKSFCHASPETICTGFAPCAWIHSAPMTDAVHSPTDPSMFGVFEQTADLRSVSRGSGTWNHAIGSLYVNTRPTYRGVTLLDAGASSSPDVWTVACHAGVHSLATTRLVTGTWHPDNVEGYNWDVTSRTAGDFRYRAEVIYQDANYWDCNVRR